MDTIGTATYSPNTVIPHLRSVPYNTKEDFTWMMQYADYTFIFSVRADSRWKTFKELIEEAQKNPGKLSYATHGPMTAQHLYMEQLFSMEKVKLNHVPLGGGAELVPQLLGGHLDAGMAAELAPHVKSGKLRGLAAQGEKRFELFPDVPTFYELGYKIDAPTWFGLCAPKGLDPRILKKLNEAFKKAYEDPSFKELCATLYLMPTFKDAETFKEIIFRDFDKHGRIIKELGFAK